jgi:hypothetical protein
LPALSIASASRSFATISSGRCFFRLLVIESLLARRAVDLHTDWIRISTAGQAAWVQKNCAAFSRYRKPSVSLPVITHLPGRNPTDTVAGCRCSGILTELPQCAHPGRHGTARAA